MFEGHTTLMPTQRDMRGALPARSIHSSDFATGSSDEVCSGATCGDAITQHTEMPLHNMRCPQTRKATLGHCPSKNYLCSAAKLPT